MLANPIHATHVLCQLILCFAPKPTANFRHLGNRPRQIKTLALYDLNLSRGVPSQNVHIAVLPLPTQFCHPNLRASTPAKVLKPLSDLFRKLPPSAIVHSTGIRPHLSARKKLCGKVPLRVFSIRYDKATLRVPAPIRVRLFFVEELLPYSWAFLPADASLQCSFRGDSNQASAYPRLSGGQPSLETVPNTVGLSPSGALPSGHSRGVLVRCRGKGGRPAMAVTTGFQGRTFDVPRTGVPCIGLPSRAPCAAADAVFADAKAFLSSSEARQMSESELERELHRRRQDLVRKLLQGHRDLWCCRAGAASPSSLRLRRHRNPLRPLCVFGLSPAECVLWSIAPRRPLDFRSGRAAPVAADPRLSVFSSAWRVATCCRRGCAAARVSAVPEPRWSRRRTSTCRPRVGCGHGAYGLASLALGVWVPACLGRPWYPSWLLPRSLFVSPVVLCSCPSLGLCSRPGLLRHLPRSFAPPARGPLADALFWRYRVG